MNLELKKNKWVIKWQRRINELQFILKSAHWTRQGKVILWRRRKKRLESGVMIKIMRFLYADRGISGKDIEHRPAMNRLLEDAKEGKFDIVLFWALSRFTRNVSDLYSTMETFNKVAVLLKRQGKLTGRKRIQPIVKLEK